MNEALRAAMTAAGETTESLAEKVRVDPKTAGRWLSPGRTPQPRHRVAVAEVLGRSVDELWPHAFRRRDFTWLRPWAQIREVAESLRWYEHSFVPGVLQTEAYARAVLGADGLLSAEDVDQRTVERLESQSILVGGAPPQLVAVMDEMILRRPVPGDAKIMGEQIETLAEAALLPNVFIHVVPASTPVYVGLQGGFILAETDTGRFAYADDQLAAQVVDSTDDLARLARTWEAVRAYALPRRESFDLLREAVKTWT